MSLINISVSKDYGYVLAVVTSTFFASTWHGLRTAASRKPSGIAYPKAFADSGDMAAAETPEAKKAMYVFNCTQRAHANYLESQPSVIAATLIAGLSYPVTSAALGAFWVVSRIIYTIGYTRPDKERGSGRLTGFMMSFLSSHAIYGVAAWTAAQMILYS